MCLLYFLYVFLEESFPKSITGTVKNKSEKTKRNFGRTKSIWHSKSTGCDVRAQSYASWDSNRLRRDVTGEDVNYGLGRRVEYKKDGPFLFRRFFKKTG